MGLPLLVPGAFLLCPRSTFSCHTSICTLGLQCFGAEAASGPPGCPPWNLRPLPGPKLPKLGLRALSVILSINTCLLDSSLEFTWPGDTQDTNMSKIRPQGAFTLVEETGSPSSSNSVASASERCEQEATVPREGALARQGFRKVFWRRGNS